MTPLTTAWNERQAENSANYNPDQSQVRFQLPSCPGGAQVLDDMTCSRTTRLGLGEAW